MSQPQAAALKRGNSRVKEVARLNRRSVRTERRLFIAEGPNSVEAALAAGVVRHVYATQSAQVTWPTLTRDAVLVEDAAMAHMAHSVTPPGLLAVCDQFGTDLADLPAEVPLALCHEVRDPGNLGTIVRTADAVGAAVAVLGEAVDPFHPKVVRAAAGSLFRVHLLTGEGADPANWLAAVKDTGRAVIAADGTGQQDLYDVAELAGPHAWLFGNEAHGLPADLRSAADVVTRIPMREGIESLNLAVAASVCLYESARARR